MRDPERLAPFYEKLWAVHMQFPDWRFIQLMSNFCQWYGSDMNELFYMEEERLVETLADFCKAMKEGNSK